MLSFYCYKIETFKYKYIHSNYKIKGDNMDITFKATVRQGGNSSVITIPSEYIGKELKVGDEYFFTVTIKRCDDVNRTK